MRKLKYLILILVITLLPLELCFAAETLSPEIQILIEKAKAGDTDAQFKIASAYDSGNGAPRDGKKAMKWYLKAAEAGMAEAQNSVGSGLQAEKQYSKALTWYAKAAQQNHPIAINNLAYLYDLGLGVKQDRLKGYELYLTAANLGWAEAMWNIANLYGAGNLGDVDLHLACIWTLRAKKYAESNDERLNAGITRTVPYLQKILKPEAFIKCQTDAEDWKPL